jgi:hypothetical protein
MRRALFLPAAALALAACADSATAPRGPAAGASLAKGGGGGNPHFLFANYSVPTSGANAGDLVFDFKQAGLGSFATADYTLTADYEAEVQCFNKAGNQPQGNPHHYTVENLSTSASFPVRNGSVTGQIVLDAPETPDLCRKPHHPVVLSASFTNISLEAPGDEDPVPPGGTLASGQSYSYR